jgi:protein-S-isoprenylcysteine O-methyltransferase Ste14
VITATSGQGKVKARADEGSALLIYASVFVSITVSFVFAGAEVGILPDPVFYLGVLLMVVGIAIREWAVVTLRQYFSFRVRIREDHKVVDSGPYSAVRHPAYTGSMLTILGLGVALRSWVGVIVLVALFSLGYGYRIRVEERALLKELGEEYALYMKRTKRLFPMLV